MRWGKYYSLVLRPSSVIFIEEKKLMNTENEQVYIGRDNNNQFYESEIHGTIYSTDSNAH